jgi:SSS family transporter
MHDFSAWNWVVLAAYLGGVFAIGVAASRYQKTSEDFFLAGRSMGLIPVGLSMCMTIFSAISYMAFVNQSYYHGMVLLMSMVMVWLDAPVICLIVIPIFYRLQLYSIYDYLERRFDLAMRVAASIIFLFWRMLWLATVVYAPCKALHVVLEIATGAEIPIEALIVGVGVATTLYTFLGGMRAVMWTDVVQFCVMLGSVLAILGVVWFSVDGGPAGVWKVVSEGGRNVFVHPKFDLHDAWCVWGIVPFYFLARVAFYTADQITVQRVLTARSLREAQKGFVLNCVGLSIFIPVLCYVGVGLYAFYQEHPDRVPDRYRVEAADGEEQEAWPYKNPETGEQLEDKILPSFIALELPVGVAGLVVSALFAACMSTMDSGLNSVSTTLIVDFHRRLGVGKRWLARRHGKRVDELSVTDELSLARPLVVIIGVFATSLACVIGNLGSIFEIARSALDTPGIPLACVFLLGMLTRRTNAAGAFSGLIVGIGTMLWLMLGPKCADAGFTFIWPFTAADGSVWSLAPIYPGIVGAILTVTIGYTVSLFRGRRLSAAELEGLCVGMASEAVSDAQE